jgi:molybdopterin converting factor small subunit
MKIRVHLILQEHTEKGEIVFPVTEPVPLLTILIAIGIPIGEVGIIVRNGRWTKKDAVVTDTDEVDLFPVLSGG